MPITSSPGERTLWRHIPTPRFVPFLAWKAGGRGWVVFMTLQCPEGFHDLSRDGVCSNEGKGHSRHVPNMYGVMIMANRDDRQ
jgi:hypothetical protein